jgi:phage/plasmid-associated DNA primase
MVKDTIKLSIDTDTLTEIKKEIPNISQFVEKIFKSYLNNREATTDKIEKEIQERNDIIRVARVELAELYGIMQRTSDDDIQHEKKVNRAFFEVTHDDYFQEDKLEEYMELLGLSKEELIRLEMLFIDYDLHQPYDPKIQQNYKLFLDKLEELGLEL